MNSLPFMRRAQLYVLITIAYLCSCSHAHQFARCATKVAEKINQINKIF